LMRIVRMRRFQTFLRIDPTLDIYVCVDIMIQPYSQFKFVENVTCPENYVKCPSSYCLARNKVCDGVKDCPLGEDEKQCGK